MERGSLGRARHQGVGVVLSRRHISAGRDRSNTGRFDLAKKTLIGLACRQHFVAEPSRIYILSHWFPVISQTSCYLLLHLILLSSPLAYCPWSSQVPLPDPGGHPLRTLGPGAAVCPTMHPLHIMVLLIKHNHLPTGHPPFISPSNRAVTLSNSDLSYPSTWLNLSRYVLPVIAKTIQL